MVSVVAVAPHRTACPPVQLASCTLTSSRRAPAMSTASLAQHLGAIAALAAVIAAYADAAEAKRRLPRPIVRALIEVGLFRLYLPRSLGGSQLESLEFAQCLDAIAALDGSTGWWAVIGNVNTWFTSPLAPACVETIFAGQPDVVTGSACFPFGRAERREGGFAVNGRWQFASGCTHCRWYFVLCQEFEGDTPQCHAHGARWPASCPLSNTTSTKPGMSAVWPARAATIWFWIEPLYLPP